MSQENEIFWLGGQPGVDAGASQLADDATFVAAIRACCEASGYSTGRFVSAKGPYGTWLIEIQRDSRQERVLWNGKDRCLVLQRRLPAGGWEDPLSSPLEATDQGGFVAAVAELLASDAAAHEPGAPNR